MITLKVSSQNVKSSASAQSSSSVSSRPLESGTPLTGGPRPESAIKGKGRDDCDEFELLSSGPVRLVRTPFVAVDEDSKDPISPTVKPESLRNLVPQFKILGSASKTHPIRLGTVLTISSGAGSGYINSSAAINNVTALAEFTSLATLFDEFFVLRMKIQYMPFSRYQAPLTFGLGSEQSNIPIGMASLHHGQTAYTAGGLGTMANNSTFMVATTGDPWEYTWKNVEKPDEGTLVTSSTSTATPSQGWCLTAATPAAAYTGFVQFLSTNTGQALPASTPVGQLFCYFYCLFRTRS